MLTGWFNTLGWPTVIRSDGGPQFCSEFVQFCNNNGIRHELSSQYNLRANSLAESEVKIVKNFLMNCIGDRGDMQRVLYEWRNVPKSHGFSLAQLLFGRSQNMLSPQPQAAFAPIDFNQAALARDQLFTSQAGHTKRDKVSLAEISLGTPVHIQNEATGLWELTGVIVEMRPDKLFYLVEIDGRVYIRGRNKMKPIFKFKEGVLDLELKKEKGEKEVGVSVSLENPEPQVQIKPSLRRSECLIEKEKSCKSVSSCSLVSGLLPDTGRQHVLLSYSLPCPALESHVRAKPTRKNWTNGSNWPSSRENTEENIIKNESNSGVSIFNF